MNEQILSIIFEGKTLAELLPNGTSISVVEEFANQLIQQRTQADTRILENHPRLINISGLPASGKTMLAKQLLETDKSLIYISFDEIMESLPCYKEDYAQNKEEAFCRWEQTAAYIGYRLLACAVEKKLSVLFEHSNATPKHLGLYRIIEQHGYAVEIRYIDATPDMLIGRLTERERFFPEDKLHQRWEALQRLIPQYKQAFKFITLAPWKG